MPEYIDRDKLIEQFNCPGRHFVYEGYLDAIISRINEQTAADVVEVVRCKNCKYFFDECCNHEKNRVLHRVPDFGNHYSYVGRMKVEPDHYCGRGERKDGEGE